MRRSCGGAHVIARKPRAPSPRGVPARRCHVDARCGRSSSGANSRSSAFARPTPAITGRGAGAERTHRAETGGRRIGSSLMRAPQHQRAVVPPKPLPVRQRGGDRQSPADVPGYRVEVARGIGIAQMQRGGAQPSSICEDRDDRSTAPQPRAGVDQRLVGGHCDAFGGRAQHATQREGPLASFCTVPVPCRVHSRCPRVTRRLAQRRLSGSTARAPRRAVPIRCDARRTTGRNRRARCAHRVPARALPTRDHDARALTEREPATLAVERTARLAAERACSAVKAGGRSCAPASDPPAIATSMRPARITMPPSRARLHHSSTPSTARGAGRACPAPQPRSVSYRRRSRLRDAWCSARAVAPARDGHGKRRLDSSMPPVELPIATPMRAGSANGSRGRRARAPPPSRAKREPIRARARCARDEGSSRDARIVRTSPAMRALRRPSVSEQRDDVADARALAVQRPRSAATSGPAAVIALHAGDDDARPELVRPLCLRHGSQCIVSRRRRRGVVPVTRARSRTRNDRVRDVLEFPLEAV